MLTPHARRTSRSQVQGPSFRSVDEPFYKSSRFGYTVTWATPWAVAESDVMDVRSPAPGTEGIAICMQDCEIAEVHIVGADRRDLLDAVETARFWASAAYLSEFTESGTRIVLSQCCVKTAALVMVSPGNTPENRIATVKESYDLGPRVSIRSTFTADMETFHEAFGSLQQNVLIDGRAPLRCFDADVLLAVLT